MKHEAAPKLQFLGHTLVIEAIPDFGTGLAVFLRKLFYNYIL
jgi:hypothetical protein